MAAVAAELARDELDEDDELLTPRVSFAMNVTMACVGVILVLVGALAPGKTMSWRATQWGVAAFAFVCAAAGFSCDLSSARRRARRRSKARMMQPAATFDVESAGELGFVTTVSK